MHTSLLSGGEWEVKNEFINFTIYNIQSNCKL